MARYIDLNLPCKLTEDEIHSKIRKLHTFKLSLRAIFGDELRYKFEIKKRKEEVEPTINSLEKEIVEESEIRWVKCYLAYDTESMTVATVRTDTGEQVGKSRAMTQEEIDKYVKLDLVLEAEKVERARVVKDAPAQDGAGTDPQTREDAPEAPAGAEPASLGTQEVAEGYLPGNSDPDGWLAEGDAAQAAAAAQEAAGAPAPETIADDAHDGGKAPEEAQGSLLEAGEAWAGVEGEKAPERN